MHRPETLLDHARYPIDELANPLRKSAIDKVRAELAIDGCALLKGFLSEAGLESLLGEAQARRSTAYFSQQTRNNAYFTDPDPSLPETHPVNIMMPRTNGFITADSFGPDTASDTLYRWEALARFLADCLGKEALFLYADPISNMIVNVMTPGTRFNWHFDTNEFTVTLLLKPARSGGIFEYAPNIRSSEQENYPEVSKVLSGCKDRVRQLNLEPGDLQCFLGRYSLHGVTENTGDEDRLLLIMSFTERPGVVGNPKRVRLLYGKTTSAHDSARVRSDTLLD